jgi:transcriptional regulator with XRE-family HTH domain
MQLGQDIRAARLRRAISLEDLAVRAGASVSTISRLEKGEPGVGVGALADTLVALGLIDRLGELIDVRKDELGLALAAEHVPRRGRTFATTLRRQRARKADKQEGADIVDPDGAAF